MSIDWTLFYVAIPAVIFSGISKAGFGSGAAFVSGAVLALVSDPGTALGLMLPLLMLIDVAALKTYWRKWDNASVSWLICGGIPGLAIGAWVYSAVSPDAIRFLIGLVCLLFLAWQFRPKRNGPARAMKGGWGALWGGVSGFTSFVSHAGGPPAAIFLLSRNLDKTTYQGTTVLVFWVLNAAKAVPYAFLGIFTLETLTMNLMLAPVALFGAWLGIRAHHIVPEKIFFSITYVLLGVTGARLIWVAVT